MVAILDADKEGFLRSETSLIQTIGRAARNVEGKVIMYADTLTDSMARAINETNRRRALQQAYNEEHGITPHTVRAAVHQLLEISREPDENTDGVSRDPDEVQITIEHLEEQMLEAAEALNFELAAKLRDQILKLKGERPAATGEKSRRGKRKKH